MADDAGRRRSNSRIDSDDNEDQDENINSVPDIGLGNRGHNFRESASTPGLSGEPGTRREDNPVFSFKHFLRGGSTGSRPKAYPSMSPPASPHPRHPEVVSGSSQQSSASHHPHQMPSPPHQRIHEVTSGLPDFVQDHLVIEQCYLNSNSQQPMAVDLDHLPDFAGHESYEAGVYCRPGGGVQDTTSLPDFLSDTGPIRRDSDSSPPSPHPPPSLPSHHSHPPWFQVENERLRLENERLRRELDSMRRQLSDQITRSETLEAELSISRNRDPPDVDILLEQMKQSNDNLNRSNKRVLLAENRAEKLKHEVQTLRNELEAMRCREGTASTSALQSDSERLASQLRNAANTAELSLRHLLIGVDNLRQLAASIESQQGFHHGQSSSGRRGAAVPGSSAAVAGSSSVAHDSSDESLDGNQDYPGPAL